MSRLPLWPKLAYTAFVAVLTPIYWMDYGPTNFLYFCDVALFMTVAALWLENSLLASAALVGILLPQLVWQIDLLATAFGLPITGMTAYMFKDSIKLFTRFLSFFHFWLPLLLLWIVWRLGYDRRGFVLWTVVGVANLLVCYFLMPPPSPDHGNQPVNINYVYGLADDKPQEWLDPNAWFAGLLIILPLLVWWPTHLLLGWLFPKPAAGSVDGGGGRDVADGLVA